MSEELPASFLRAIHRKPALVQPSVPLMKALKTLLAHEPNDNTPPQIPDAKPIEQPPALEGASGGETQGTGRPCVSYLLRRVKLLDVDAKFTSVKDTLDGLAKAGFIQGDREDQITLEVRQEKVGHYKEEETLIRITYP